MGCIYLMHLFMHLFSAKKICTSSLHPPWKLKAILWQPFLKSILIALLDILKWILSRVAKLRSLIWQFPKGVSPKKFSWPFPLRGGGGGGRKCHKDFFSSNLWISSFFAINMTGRDRSFYNFMNSDNLATDEVLLFGWNVKHRMAPGLQNLAAFRRGQKWPWKFASTAYLQFSRQMHRFCA